jgi:hypothetical protein
MTNIYTSDMFDNTYMYVRSLSDNDVVSKLDEIVARVDTNTLAGAVHSEMMEIGQNSEDCRRLGVENYANPTELEMKRIKLAAIYNVNPKLREEKEDDTRTTTTTL